MTERQQQFLDSFEPIRERLWRFVRAMVFKYDSADAEVANDIMSETVLQCIERFEELRDKQAMLSFCFTIASRIYKAQFVRRKFWGLYEEEVVAQIPDNQATPDVHTDIRLLYDALNTLPPTVREALVLFEISDVPLEEIQRIQGGSLSGVKSRIRRGRQTLAAILGASPREQEEEEQAALFNEAITLLW